MKKVILLLNMGGPHNLDEVEVFLKNMFEDPYILGIKNSLLRKFVASIITFFRKKPAKHNYSQIGSKSPINEITESLCKKVAKFSGLECDFVMNYTPPFAKDVIKKYKDFDEIILFPLYPHHSVTTVSSSLDDAIKAINELNSKAKITQIPVFYESEIYNRILLSLIKEKISPLSRDELSKTSLIFSAHSLPESIIKNGDLYEEHIKNHINLMSEILHKNDIKFKEIKLAYQSKLGPVKWLSPNLSEILPNLPNKRTLIVPISFCIDNSETIFELAIEYGKIAKESNFEFYEVCKCPNDSDEFARFIAKEANISH